MAFPTNATGGGTTNQVIAPNLAQHARGIGVVFEADFFDDAPNNTTPAVPANPAESPSYTIVDPSGVQVNSGVGTPGSQPGRWTASWAVPQDAPLSTQSNKWRIVWNMVAQTARQLQQTLPFDVIELRTPDTLDDVRAESYMVYAGNSERVVLRLPRRPDEISIQGFMSSSLTNPCPSDTALFTGSLAGGTIVEVEEQNLFAYIFDTPALTDFGEIQVVWNYRQTITSPTETTVQRIFVPPSVFWSLGPSLRVLIDKLQKRQGAIQSYPDSDLFEYFQRGLGILNGTTPASDWSLLNFPYASTTTRFLIEAAALWAMHAQQLLAGELQFSFSGQSVTLDIDQQGVYDTIASKLLEDLRGTDPGAWPSAKRDIIRQATPIAHVANRLMGKYGMNQYTYKVYSSGVGAGSPNIYDPTQFRGPGVNVGFTLTDTLIYLNLV